MTIRIHNTLTRKKEEFKPLRNNAVGMYVCGPTVYGHSHIGHGKSYVSFDIIVRWLRYSGYQVTYIQNITDVGHLLGETNEGEDRLLKQSRLEQKHPMEIAEFYTRSYFEDMDALCVTRPDISPRATGHITEQIEIIKQLIAKGFAYEANGSVYFDVSKDKEYGKLSGRNTEEAEAGTRVDVKTEKRHPNDFALWKFAEPEHIMRWPSPWGMGFPGWHVECSAMSMKYLGETFDIHGGGMDNQFPHHECEIAQSECATGKPFVRYWIHNNLVTVGGQKMSKSLGNFVTLKDLFKKYDPLVVRFLILQSHYHGTLDFSDEGLQGAKIGLTRLQNAIRSIREAIRAANEELPSTQITLDIAPYKKKFIEAMDDDFNTPRAIAVLFDLAAEANIWLSSAPKPSKIFLQEIDALFRELGGDILGIVSDLNERTESGDVNLLEKLIGLLLKARHEIRVENKYWIADHIRKGLEELGIKIEDKKDGPTWRRS